MDLQDLYFSAHGRLGRRLYCLASLPLIGLGFLADVPMTISQSPAALLVTALLYLASTVPAGVLTTKRLHDRDRSGWFMLVGGIPLVGTLWLLIDLTLLPGTPGPNRFGPDPLAADDGVPGSRPARVSM
jgi:uncharacterized membrane protein YhaH (DUF805 family)